MPRTVRLSALVALTGALGAAALGTTALSGQSGYTPATTKGDWTHYTADVRGSKYSPLDQITAANFKELEVAWRFKTDNLGTRAEYKLEGTPLAIKGILYTTAGTRRSVIALDGASGELLWTHRYPEGKRGAAAPRQLSGRGLSVLDRRQGRRTDLVRDAGLSPDRAQRENGPDRPFLRHGRRRRHEGGRHVRRRQADRPRDRRNRVALDTVDREGRRARRFRDEGRHDGHHAQQHQGRGARLRRQNRPDAVAVQYDSASRRVRQRDLVEQLVGHQR